MILSLPDPKQASRVVRTLYQGVIASVTVALPLVAIFELPAAKVTAVLATVTGVLAAVSKVFQQVFPAEPALPEPEFEI